MFAYLNTYLDNDYKLIATYNDKVFVFEKNNEIHLSQVIKPSDDNNKDHIGINSLKDAMNVFVEASKFYKNITHLDFVLSSIVTPQSREKFWGFLKEANTNNYTINFCGLVKLKDKL